MGFLNVEHGIWILKSHSYLFCVFKYLFCQIFIRHKCFSICYVSRGGCPDFFENFRDEKHPSAVSNALQSTQSIKILVVIIFYR